MQVIAVANLKGGVGKTTSAVYLGHLYAAREATVLLDTDPQGSALAWSEGAHNFPFPVIAPAAPHLRDLSRRLPQYVGGAQQVIVDTPPSHAEIVRSAAAVADLVLIPVSPFAMDLDRLVVTIDLLASLPADHSPEVRVLLTNVRSGTNSLAAARAALEALAIPVLGLQVPRREAIGNSYGASPAGLWHYQPVLDALEAVAAA